MGCLLAATTVAAVATVAAQGGEGSPVSPESSGDTLLIPFLISLFASLLFTGAQTAVSSIGPLALDQIDNSTNVILKFIKPQLKKLPAIERQFSLGGMFALIFQTALVALFFIGIFEDSVLLGAIIAMVIVSGLHLLLVEGFCRNLVLASPERAFKILIIPSYILSLPFRLLLLPHYMFSSFPDSRVKYTSLTDMHLRLLPSLSGIERVIDEEAFELIDSVKEFAETKAEEIMTPRTEIEGISDTLGPTEVYEWLRKSEYRRIVIYHDNLDDIRGTLLAKDVLLNRPRQPFDNLRDPIYVNEDTRLPELLNIIRLNRSHLVIVQDEYGGTAGIVTLHDLVENIVGHIDDLEDEDELWIEKDSDSSFVINGRTELWEVNEELDLDLDEDVARTIGGLVFNTLGRVGEVDDYVVFDNVKLTVLETSNNRVEVVKLEILPETPQETEEVTVK